MKKNILYIFLFFILFSQPAFCAGNNYYEMGRQAYTEGDYKLAQRYFWAILNNEPSNLNARYYLAHSLAKQQKYDDAAVEYQRIIQSSPNSTTGKYAKESLNRISPYLKHTSQELDTASKAAQDTKKDYFINALSSGSQIMRWAQIPVYVYIPDSNYKDVVKSAFQVWQNGTKGILKFAYTTNRENAQIEVFFKDKLENTSTEKTYLSGMTKPYFKGNDLVKAEITLLTVNPNSKQPMPKENLYATALHEIGHAIGIKGHSQNSSDVMYSSGAGSKKTLSARDYNTVKLLYETNPEDLKGYSSNIYSAKIKEASAYIAKYPDKAVGWLNLADIYRSNKQYAKAIEMYNKALSIDKSLAEPYYFIAECRMALKQYSLAINYYQMALSRAKDNKYYLYNFARACMLTNNKNLGQKYLNQYLTAHPKDANDKMITDIKKMLK